jgi:hypothetical protein
MEITFNPKHEFDSYNALLRIKSGKKTVGKIFELIGEDAVKFGRKFVVMMGDPDDEENFESRQTWHSDTLDEAKKLAIKKFREI